MATNRYKNIPIILSETKRGQLGFQIQRSTRYPEIPSDINDTYAYTTQGDRLDLLAQEFYGDISLWWIIAAGNPEVLSLNSLFIPVGTEIRIPSNVSLAQSLFNKLNRV
jgi:phage tail protein X